MQKRWATTSNEIGLDKRFMQRRATSRNRCQRIMALEKVAGSILVRHPPKLAANGLDIDILEPTVRRLTVYLTAYPSRDRLDRGSADMAAKRRAPSTSARTAAEPAVHCIN